ncbi:MAG: response regulator transcription factor [Dehalococcoidia bacterium]
MKVAIIEDDQEITEVVSVAFEMAWPGSQVVGAPNAVEGMEMLKTENPDVVILDIGLPEGDTSGFDLCKEFRSFSNVPVIMVTARDREVDIVRGLELGAADYMIKPFSAVELLARIRAIMRRVQVGSLGSQTQPFVSKELSVDFDDRQVLAQGEPVKLTPTEYKLLCYLIRNPRQVLTNDAIVEAVWGSSYRNSEGLVKAHIQRLRKKLKDSTQNPRLIITERGRGYRFIGSN